RTAFEVIDDVRGKINEALPRLRIEFVQILSDVINDLAGAARPVEIKLFGAQLDSLEQYATKLDSSMSKVDGLEDFFNGVSEPGAEMLVRVSSAEANRLGMTPEQVGDAVSGPLLGVEAGEVRLDDRAELLRENQQQLIIMTADVADRPLGNVMRDVRAVLSANPPPPGIRVELAGQYAGQQQAFRALLIVLGLAAVSVIAVMVIQFESFIEPLIVTLVAPVSFLGALVLLMVTGTVLNVSSMMGLILL